MQLSFSQDDLRPLIETVVAEVLAKTAAMRATERIAYTEVEAASLLGVKPHTLRDSRRRQEITGSKVGRYITYTRDELLAYLARQQTN